MRPPGLPTLKPLTPMFGGLYAAAYGLGGQPLVRKAMARYGPVISLPVLGFGNVVAVADATMATGRRRQHHRIMAATKAFGGLANAQLLAQKPVLR